MTTEIDAKQIKPGELVKSVNGLFDDITLAAGSNITIVPTGNTLTINSTGGSGSPSAPNLSVQYNSSGSFAGDSEISVVDVTAGQKALFVGVDPTTLAPGSVITWADTVAPYGYAAVVASDLEIFSSPRAGVGSSIAQLGLQVFIGGGSTSGTTLFMDSSSNLTQLLSAYDLVIGPGAPGSGQPGKTVIFNGNDVFNPTADHTALIDMQAVDRGFLLPRVTTIQRDGIQKFSTGFLLINSQPDPGSTVTIGADTLTEGVEWTADPDNNVTAASLAAAIDALASTTAFQSAYNTVPPVPGIGAYVIIFAAVVGPSGDAITTSTSDTVNIYVPQANLSGGLSAQPGLQIFNTDTNQVEFWNGTAWTGMGGGGTPGGADTNIQVNTGGTFGGTSEFTFSSTGFTEVDINDNVSGNGSRLNLNSDSTSAIQIQSLDQSTLFGEIVASPTAFIFGANGNIILETNIAGTVQTWNFGPEGYVSFPNLTTTQRNAITAVEGMQIYNVTTHQFEQYNGTMWAAMGGGSGSPGGANTQVQFNDSGSFNGSPYLTLQNNIVFSRIMPTISGPTNGTANLVFMGTPSSSASGIAFFNSDGIHEVGELDAFINGSPNSGFATLAITADPSFGPGRFDINTINADQSVGSLWEFTEDGTIIFPQLTSTQRNALSTHAFGFINNVNYTALSGAVLTINGFALTEGVDWTAAIDNATTEVSLFNAIITNMTACGVWPAWSSYPDTILVKAIVEGPAGQSITLATSDAINLPISGSSLNYALPPFPEGQLIYNVTTHEFEFYNGTAWVPMGGGGSDVAYSEDLFTSDGTNNPTFALSGTPVANSEYISLNGLALRPTTDYIVAGANLTIDPSVTLTNGDVIVAKYATTITGSNITAFDDDLYTSDGTNNPTFVLTAAPMANAEFITLNGTLLRPTIDYTVSGTNLTIDPSVALTNGDVIQAKYATGTGGGGGTPGGSNTQVQFNNSGAFGADANFTWDGSQITVGGLITIGTNQQLNGVTSMAAGDDDFALTAHSGRQILLQAGDDNTKGLTIFSDGSMELDAPSGGSILLKAGALAGIEIDDNVVGLGRPMFFDTVNTAARDAFGNQSSWMIYNTDTQQPEFNNGSAWLPMTGGTDERVGAASTTFTVTTETVVAADATGAPFTVALPPVASSNGRRVTVKKIDSSSNAVTIDADSADTIDGSLTQVINTQWDSLTMICNGSVWLLI